MYRYAREDLLSLRYTAYQQPFSSLSIDTRTHIRTHCLLFKPKQKTNRGCRGGRHRRIKAVITRRNNNARLKQDGVNEKNLTIPHIEKISPQVPVKTMNKNNPGRGNEPTNKSILRTLIINFQSLWNKKEELTHIVQMTNSDIIIGNETWLREEIKNEELNIADAFEIYRKDRKNQCKRGGGIIIGIKKTLSSESLNHSFIKESEEEIMFCKINIKSRPPLIIGAVYRPPDKNVDVSKRICEIIKKVSQEHKKSIIWIGGDFNLPDINWTDNSIKGNQYPKALNSVYIEAASDSGLQQAVTECTRKDALLDLFFTTHPSYIEKVSNLPGLGDHDVVQVDNRIEPKRKRPVKRKIYVWKKADIPKMKDEVKKSAQLFIEHNSPDTDVCQQWEYFASNIKTIMKDNVPQKYTTSKIHQPWINTKTKRLIRKKNKLYLRAKRTNSDSTIKLFQAIKALTQRECRKAHRDYVKEMVNDMSNNNKKLWSYIKGMNREKTGIPPLKDNNGILQTDPKTKANILNQQFSSVFSDPTKQVTTQEHNIHHNEVPQMNEIEITANGVAKLLKNIKEDKATGPDDIPAKFIKTCANELAPALALIFQSSLKQGKLPDEWRQGKISPIFKKGEKSKAENYRPVSITSITCKILEHIIYSNIINHQESHKLLTDIQHGFRKERSCETQLITTCNDLAENLNKGLQTDAILLDFSKAFDKVHHHTLSLKLWTYGIRGETLNWIMSFLTNRKQVVVVDGAMSEPASVLSGVPQGTVLGPLLFLIYINDIAQRISPGTHLRLFADDSLLYRTIQSRGDSEALQYDLNELQNWEKENSMEFHPQKCQVLKITNKRNKIQSKYTIHGIILEEVKKAKYLGVTINNKLTWKDHIDSIYKKANSTLGFLRRNLYDCNQETKTKCYVAFVRPILEYCSTIWDPHHKREIHELDMIQQRATKFIQLNNKEKSKDKNKPDLEPLRERRKRDKLTIFFKGLKDQAKLPLKNIQLNKRKPDTFMIPHSRIDTHLHSFLPSTIRLWNNLPSEIKTSRDANCFKKECAKLRILHPLK